MPSWMPRACTPLFVVVAFVALSGCGGSAQPRTSRPVPWQEFAKIGGVVDASRGFPVAFYADPGAEPRTANVDGTTLYVGDWLTHMAKRMNQALAKVSLYDTRFMAVAQKLFTDEIVNGAYTYPYRGASKEMQASALHARIASLQFESATRVSIVAESGVRVVVKLKLFSMTRLYVHEATGPHWDHECFTRIAEKILSDGDFWRAVQTAP